MTVLKEKTKSYNSGGKDSLQKIIDVYFSHITSEEFTFNNKKYFPKNLRVSPNILRGFSCLANCGACCRDFTLDFLPEENEKWGHNLAIREVEFNGRIVEVYTDFNTDDIKDAHGRVRCKNLNLETGRCGIHTRHPFSCDFELLRFIVPNPKAATVVTPRLSHQLFGRGWAMSRIDGNKGAMCSMLDRTEKDRETTMRKLERLKDWTDHFGLQTVIPKIILWLKTIELATETPLMIYQVVEENEVV